MVKYVVIVAFLFCVNPEDGAVKTKLTENQNTASGFAE